MAIARSKIIDLSRPGWIHCISRCVRRAFLCGDGFDHRKAWVEDRLRFLAGCFALETAGYAVMANHLHLIVRMRPAEVSAWSAEEVARRWLSVYPRSYHIDGTPKAPDDELVQRKAQDWSWVSLRRKRLADLSWYMKALKEAIAKRANREDRCTGAFWEERFASVPLLDQAALIACMAYVDLNPVRAKVATTPEGSQHTSVRARIRARQRHRTAQRLRALEPKRAARLLTQAGLAIDARDAEDGLWLAPLARCTADGLTSGLSVDDYLTLVDATGRIVREGKRGRIPPELAPILARLDLRVESWIATMLDWRQMAGAAIGAAAARAVEATRRGVHWVKNRCALFAATA